MSSINVYRNLIYLLLTPLLNSKSTFGFKFKTIVKVGLLNSVLSNPSTRIAFRTGEIDSKKLESHFAHFDSEDLSNLPVGNAICKVDTPGEDFNLIVPPILNSVESGYKENYENCLAITRRKYSRPRLQIEKLIEEFYSDSISAEVPTIKETNKSTENKSKPVIEPINLENNIENLDAAKETYIESVEKVKRVSEHRKLQQLVKNLAESYGFRAVIEEPMNNGYGRVDVGLTKETLRIAVEISVTNSLAYETSNIRKCIENGYQTVVMCCENKRHLGNIEEKAVLELSEEQKTKVQFLTYQDLSKYFSQFESDKETKTVNVIKGYRIKVKYK